MKRLLLSLMIVLSFSLGACARAKPLLTPTFETTSGKSDVVARAIRASLLQRGWSIVSDRPGRIEATYRKGNQSSATVAVVYAGRQVTIQHVNSANLLYGVDAGGQPVIHRAYNNWVTFLERDIQSRVAATS